MTKPLHPAVRAITVAAVVVVALIAAIVSYSHMEQLAYGVGEGWRSWLIPISIDGLVVAASMTLLTRHRAGLPTSYLGWGALGGGILASVAANMADARPEVTAVLLAGWAPVAFAIGFELLLLQRRAERHVTDGAHSTSVPTETVRQIQPEPPTRTSPTPTAIAPTVSAPVDPVSAQAVPSGLPLTPSLSQTQTPMPISSAVSSPSMPERTVSPTISPARAGAEPPRAPAPPIAGRGTTTARGHSNTEWARGVTRPTRPRPGSVLTEEEWATMDGLTDAGISDFDVGKRMGRSEATVKKRRLERQQRRVQRNGDERMARR